MADRSLRGHVLVGGWPASGKTTLARALASELGVPYLGKDEVKESLMDVLGAPTTVEESHELGRAAVHAVLRAARGCPAAVIDSTWFDYSLPLVRDLGGHLVEVRCVLPRDVAQERYSRRERDGRHLDGARTADELWGRPVAPLGVGALIEVATEADVDVSVVSRRVRSLLADASEPPAGG